MSQGAQLSNFYRATNESPSRRIRTHPARYILCIFQRAFVIFVVGIRHLKPLSETDNAQLFREACFCC